MATESRGVTGSSESLDNGAGYSTEGTLEEQGTLLTRVLSPENVASVIVVG